MLGSSGLGLALSMRSNNTGDQQPSRRSLWGYVWASPASALGLLAALPLLLSGTRPNVINGVLELAAGPGLRGWWLPSRVAAITFGHVVLGRCSGTLQHWRRHEHAHVRQYERWGVLFFLLYLGDSLCLWLHGRDAYRDNRFERAARKAELE